MDTQATEPNGTPAPAPEKKKTLFETVLAATPVLLTVVATFMVGQSSSEMTRAMYFRAVAGQNQSKVGDQWSFFQAKRIRGTTYEVNVDNFMAKEEPVPITKESVLDQAAKVAANVKNDKKEGKKVADAVETLKNRLDKGFTIGRYDAKDPKKNDYSPERINNAFAFIKDYESPRLPRAFGDSKPEEKSAAAEKDEQQKILEEVKKAIEERQSEKDIAKIVIKLTDETLHDAIEKADADAKETAKKSKEAERVMEQVDILIDNLARTVYEYLGSSGDAQSTAAVEQVRGPFHRLMISYKNARHVFTHRRYEKDSRANQDSAMLYEVKVYHSSAKSDRHMERSKNFLYAMLVAQVGVIIASMAMAVKQKSLVWLLATFAGLVAIGFGGYVFLGLN